VPHERQSHGLVSKRRSRAISVGVGVLAISLTLATTASAQSTGGAVAEATPTPAPAPVATPAPAPAKPSTKAIQRALGIKADGVMGPQTRRALKRYQRAHDLKVTGRADAATLASLGLTAPQQNANFDAVDAPTVLAKIAQCESGGDITAVSRNGKYFGKYQFSQATWEAMGGEGNPAEADEATQDALAQKLYALRGTAPWPACSAELQQD
jgi:peptidoglycan hydrolase-like protein with peptidoglycan-binding domain